MLVFVVISCSIIKRLFLCVVMQVLIIFVVKVTLRRMLRSDAGGLSGVSAVRLRACSLEEVSWGQTSSGQVAYL